MIHLLQQPFLLSLSVLELSFSSHHLLSLPSPWSPPSGSSPASPHRTWKPHSTLHHQSKLRFVKYLSPILHYKTAPP
ncbi:hypothetical protein HanRHA438_Chr10g0459971 [Helianthus annuus]|nr:hypothetical protein HanRHA438_Chr10g0459971 [Helianthus annuus]